MGALFVILLYIGLIGTMIYGYVNNIITLVNHVGEFAIMELVRVIGIVMPLVGIVMGFVG